MNSPNDTGPGSGHNSPDPVAELQGDLVAQPAEAPEPNRTDAFLTFHHQNPHVYVALRTLAREWIAEGKRKCGLSMFYGTARWRLSLEIEGDGMFELNDHHQPYYARALMHFEPELAGLFELRRAPEADAWIAQYKRTAAA